MTLEVARQCTNDRKKWRALVHMKLIELYAAILLGPVFFRPPSRTVVVITWRGVGCGWVQL